MCEADETIQAWYDGVAISKETVSTCAVHHLIGHMYFPRGSAVRQVCCHTVNED